jgi:hypothetical protein
VSERRKREKAAARRAAASNGGKGPRSTCPNCHVTHYGPGHFVPPSFGDPGFFLCEGGSDA